MGSQPHRGGPIFSFFLKIVPGSGSDPQFGYDVNWVWGRGIRSAAQLSSRQYQYTRTIWKQSDFGLL